MGFGQAGRETAVLARLLEWRVDEHKPAPFRWRELGLQRGPTVIFDGTKATSLSDERRQRGVFFRMPFMENKTILRARERNRDSR